MRGRHHPSRPSGRAPRILFAFENPLPSAEADAEVFISTARALRPHLSAASFHVPVRPGTRAATGDLVGMTVVPAWAPLAPAILRHVCCGLTLPLRREYRRADLVYTRNLWIAFVVTLCGKDVVFDHYRPWSDQIPPLRWLLFRLHRRRRFLVNICHSDYTRRAYAALGIGPDKLHRVFNGFDPARIGAGPTPDHGGAKRAIDVAPDTPTVVYTGRLNGRKGLQLLLAAAATLPDLLFILVGSAGHGPIEDAAAVLPNVRVVPWQAPAALRGFIEAADILLIPPSTEPLSRYGSTVLPLKVFLYLASGRPILAGDTPDLREILRHGENAFLCSVDDAAALASAIRTLLADRALAAAIAAAAVRDSASLTWDARAGRILAVLEARRRATTGATGAAERGLWGPAQRRAWRSGSLRWLGHLVRARSWVLPPDPARLRE